MVSCARSVIGDVGVEFAHGPEMLRTLGRKRRTRWSVVRGAHIERLARGMGRLAEAADGDLWPPADHCCSAGCSGSRSGVQGVPHRGHALGRASSVSGLWSHWLLRLVAASACTKARRSDTTRRGRERIRRPTMGMVLFRRFLPCSRPDLTTMRARRSDRAARCRRIVDPSASFGRADSVHEDKSGRSHVNK
jgi:hypothetical protein